MRKGHEGAQRRNCLWLKLDLSGMEAMRACETPAMRLKHELQDVSLQLNEKISELEARKDYAEKIIDTVQNPLLVLDSDLVVRHANDAFYNVFAVKSPDPTGCRIFELGNGQWDIPALRMLLEQILPDKERLEDYEIEHEFPHIGQRILLVNAQRVDQLQRILLAIEDITDRRQAEERHELLVSELNHRVKNVLATVQSMLARTARGAASPEQLEESLSGRLRALSRGHEILVGSDWRILDLGKLIRAVLQPFDSGERVNVDCEALHLRPRAALAFNLVLHELATNAAKFGALSGHDGRIHIDCRAPQGNETHATLRWMEDGGPAVIRVGKKGYGLSLVERSVEHELFGSAEMMFRPEGLKCVINFSADVLGGGGKS